MRAFAVLAVLADHLIHRPSGGFAGVDIFFVISGFLITGLLLREFEKTGTISFTRFYASRAKRILPAATLTLVSTVLVAYTLFGSVRGGSIANDAFWAFLFGANWDYAIAGTDYFASDAAVSPLQHYWSLSVEEQYYFVWPWLLLALLLAFGRFLVLTPRRARLIAGMTIGVICVGSFAWAILQSASSPTFAYFSTFTRVWELGVGSLLAVVAPLFVHLRTWMRVALAYVGLGMMTASVIMIDQNTVWPAPGAMVPVLATAMVLASGIGSEAPGNILLRNPIAVYLGDISYSLYLWHFPVITFSNAIFPQRDWAIEIITVAVSFALAIGFYHAIERPLHHAPIWIQPSRRLTWREWWTRHRRSGVAGGLGVVFTAVAVVMVVAAVPRATAFDVAPPAVVTEGETAGPESAALLADVAAALGSRTWPEDIEHQISAGGGLSAEELACSDPASWKPDGCAWGDGDHIAMIVGDSLANAYAPLLRDILVPRGWRVVQMTLNGCEFNTVVLASERSQPSCQQRVESALRASVDLSPDLVFVSSKWVNHKPLGASKALSFDQWWNGAEDALSRIAAPVIYLAPAPSQRSIDSCYNAVALPANCISEVSKLWTLSDEKLRAYDSQKANFAYVDSRQWFCYETKCPAVVRGNLTRADYLHPAQSYLEIIEPAVVEALMPLLAAAEGDLPLPAP